MRDFTLYSYARLLGALQHADYTFCTFADYIRQTPNGRFVILRHDVDKRAVNSLRTAQLEYRMGIRASYYFRVVPASNQPVVIRSIAALGHEIGYHYEDMALAAGDVAQAEAHFRKWLDYFRTFYPVETICMHGAPTQRWDSRELWEHVDYKTYGLVGEPYFDVDFSDVFYLTDTGRRWDGYRVSVRDKIPVHQDEWVRRGWVYPRTEDIIAAAEAGSLPPHIMITTHPQRWTDSRMAWLREWAEQNVKNVIKRLLVSCKN